MEIEYTKVGDYYLPNLTIEKQDKSNYFRQVCTIKISLFKRT